DCKRKVVLSFQKLDFALVGKAFQDPARNSIGAAIEHPQRSEGDERCARQVSHWPVAPKSPKTVRPDAASVPSAKVAEKSPLTRCLVTTALEKRRLPLFSGGKVVRGSLRTSRAIVPRWIPGEISSARSSATFGVNSLPARLAVICRTTFCPAPWARKYFTVTASGVCDAVTVSKLRSIIVPRLPCNDDPSQPAQAAAISANTNLTGTLSTADRHPAHPRPRRPSPPPVRPSP